MLGWIRSLEQVASLPAVLDSLAPALEEFKGMADPENTQALREAGFEALMPVVDSAQVLVGLMDKLRRAARVVLEGILPAEALAELRASVERLDTTLRDMRTQLDSPPQGKALAAGGGA